jgi:hypothetical protein
LEAGVEPNEEGMIGSCFKHMLLRLNPINILLSEKNNVLELRPVILHTAYSVE